MTLKKLDIDPVSPNMLAMWRCVICMAHADGVLAGAELAYFQKTIAALEERHALTATQKQTLLDDLDHPKNISDLIGGITDPAYRSQVITFARVLAYKDGHMDPNEEALLQKIQAAVLPHSAELEQIRAQVRTHVKAQMLKHDAVIYDTRPHKDDGWGISAFFDRLLLKFGIDLSE